VGMIDIDGLMAVNDLLGHRAGDALLRTVAGRLLTHIRLPRVVIRLGGDEFTFVMEGLSPHRIGG
jgi:diguanylate cyclase (GGDEF)-like protein